MANRYFLLLLFSLCSLSSPFSQATEFSKYSAEVLTDHCKDLDYNSYFRAQNARNSLIRGTPDRAHANFGGKYLLLKYEMLAETQWLIADCTTGKFLHETISGNAEFKPDSSLAIVKNASEPPAYQLWSGDKWIRVDGPAMPMSSPTNPSPSFSAAASSAALSAAPSTAPSDILAQYQMLYSKHEVATSTMSCKDLDFDSYFRAQSGKFKLISNNPDRSHPNFAGKFLMLKNESIFETFWLIADCSTGKFFHEMITGNASFKPDSRLILVNTSGNYPKLMVWSDDQWMQILDPVQNKNQKIKNTIYGKDAKALLHALNIRERTSLVRFDRLTCTTAGACTFLDPAKKAGQDSVSVTAEKALEITPVLQKWGTGGEPNSYGVITYRIQTGRCSSEKGEPECEVETQANL